MGFFLTFIPLLIWSLAEKLLDLIVTLLSPAACRSYPYKFVKVYFGSGIAAYSFTLARYVSGTGVITELAGAILLLIVGASMWLSRLTTAYRNVRAAKSMQNETAVRNHSAEVIAAYGYIFLPCILTFIPQLMFTFMTDFCGWALIPLFNLFYSETFFWIGSVIGLVSFLPALYRAFVMLSVLIDQKQND